jgi:hypothetical protein
VFLDSPEFIADETDRELQSEIASLGFIEEAGVHAGFDGM